MITKITKRWLVKKQACQPGIEWFESQKETDPIKIIKLCFKIDLFNWANWLITRLLTKKELGMYAVFAAEQVIDIFEERYPEDDRPKKAIEAAKKCIKNPTRENKYAAFAYAASAASIAYASASVVTSAFAAVFASSAAYATAYAAFASAFTADFDFTAAYAAVASAYSASAADASKTGKKIIDYGIKLLRSKKHG